MSDPLPPRATPDAVDAPLKPGMRTSEFALKLIADALSLLFASGWVTDAKAVQIMGIAAVVLGSLGYTVARTCVKTAAMKDPPPF